MSRVEDPGQGRTERDDHRQQLRHKGDRLLLDLRSACSNPITKPDDRAGDQHRRGNQRARS